MISRDGAVKITDFGLADIGERSRITKEGSTAGTTAYMSPEQARGEKPDTRTDIWSLGVVMYEMLAGRLPFTGVYDQATLYQILSEEPDPLTSLRSDVPMELERIIGKAMRKDRNERYQRVEEVLTDLRSLRKEIEIGRLKERLPRGEIGRGKRPFVYIGLAVLLALVAAAALYLLTGREEAIESIAVLPLENLSGDASEDYFTDGMTEALIAQLANVGPLRVISRTSVMQYKGVKKSLPDIARELNVDAIVEGSVLRSGERVRITAQLIHAPTDRHLWAESYERELSDVLRLQSQLARAIARQIQVKLTPRQEAQFVSAGSIDPEAYEAYLKGRYHWNKRFEEDVLTSIEYFRRAIDIDPTYALAYAGLADSYNMRGSYGHAPPKDVMPRAKAAAVKALEIDSTLAEAHASLGYAYATYDWDWKAGEREYKRAIELNPNYATAHHWYGLYLTTMGRSDEAVDELERARVLDPLSLIINTNVGWVLYFARLYDQAIEQFRKTLELDPNFVGAHWKLRQVYEKKGMYEEAIVELETLLELLGASELAGAVRRAYLLSGYNGALERWAESLEEHAKREHVSPYDIVLIYAQLNVNDQAFALLEKGYEVRDGLLVYLNVDPQFDNLRTDPRFSALVRKIGLEK